MFRKSCWIILIGLSLIGYGYALGKNEIPDFTPAIYLWLALSIFMSRSLAIVKKIGLPLVTSEIFAGIILGNLHYVGISTFSGMEHNEIIQFLAQIGAMILMFEIGLETQLEDITSKLGTGTKIALYGTILTFAGGYLASQYLYPSSGNSSYILIGLICAATATGISGKVFKELKVLDSIEVKTVLSASLIDEVISILCFAILSGLMVTGIFSVHELVISSVKTALFFLISIGIGSRITPLITKLSIKIHSGINMKIGILFMICTFYTWLASQLGLAPVIGAFIAGIIIKPQDFQNFSQAKFLRDFKQIAQHTNDENARLQIIKTVNTYQLKSLDELVKPLSNIFVPIFFTYIGLILNLPDLLNIKIFSLAILLIIVSLLGRIIGGLSNSKNLNILVIGLGMTPIGEAGLIFAITGQQLGILSNDILSAVIVALVIITILVPILLKYAIKNKNITNF